MYSVLDYLWSDDDDFDFLVSYIKPDYKIFRKNLKNLKNSTLSDDIISCYLDELIVSSKKVNNILILKSIISTINFFFVTNNFTTNFQEYLCNNNSVNPSLYFLLLKRHYQQHFTCSFTLLFLQTSEFLDKRQLNCFIHIFIHFLLINQEKLKIATFDPLILTEIMKGKQHTLSNLFLVSIVFDICPN